VSRHKERGIVGLSVEQEDDVECFVDDAERQGLMAKITDEVRLKHPITYDIYDLCELHQRNKISTFHIPMLKNILSHLDISSKSKEKKASLVQKLKEVISECEYDASLCEHLK